MPRNAPPAEPSTAPISSELAPLEAFAVGKAVGERQLKELRPRLTAGAGQAVDLTLRIAGLINVAENSTSTQIKSVPADKMLAFVLGRLGARARNPLAAAVESEFADWRRGGELPPIEEASIDLADDLIRAASRKENVQKNGAVSAALEVRVVRRR